MSTGTILIQFDYDDEDLSLQRIERKFAQLIKRDFDSFLFTLTHIEAAPGNMDESFGVGQ